MRKSAVYLDNAAGTPPSRPVLERLRRDAGRFWAHPAALHAPAAEAAERLEQLRRRAGRVLAVKPESLIFVHGASEANCLLARSLRLTYPEGRLAGLEIDHDSWRAGCDRLLAVDGRSGRLDPSAVLRLADDVVCLSLAGVNNELGVVQPFAALKRALAEARQLRQEKGNRLPLLLHVDASQMALVHNIQPQALAAADLLTLNGAKVYALRRSGLVYLRPGLRLRPPWEEAGWQPGGEGLLAAGCLTVALERLSARRAYQGRRLGKLQAWFEAGLEKLGGEVACKRSERSPHLTTAVFRGYDNERLALDLSRRGIYVGIGSACRSRSDLLRTSALGALGYGREEVYGALRFSYAYETTRRQLSFVLKVLAKLLEVGPR